MVRDKSFRATGFGVFGQLKSPGSNKSYVYIYIYTHTQKARASRSKSAVFYSLAQHLLDTAKHPCATYSS